METDVILERPRSELSWCQFVIVYSAHTRYYPCRLPRFLMLCPTPTLENIRKYKAAYGGGTGEEDGEEDVDDKSVATNSPPGTPKTPGGSGPPGFGVISSPGGELVGSGSAHTHHLAPALPLATALASRCGWLPPSLLAAPLACRRTALYPPPLTKPPLAHLDPHPPSIAPPIITPHRPLAIMPPPPSHPPHHQPPISGGG